MSLAAALQLAALGFHVFPCVPNSKLPAISDFPTQATRDEAKIRAWWIDPVLEIEQPYNIGISTSRFGDDEALLVIDVDNKGEKKGDDELRRLQSDGKEFPLTFEQRTPSGGRHLVYRTREAARQGTNVLGRGLDIRARGGYIVGASSSLGERAYTCVHRDVVPASAWLIEHCRDRARRDKEECPAGNVGSGVDKNQANDRAVHFLTQIAPIAVEGEGGDAITFEVACSIKDFGVDEETCLELMFERWNSRCEPPWTHDGLARKVANAYHYGKHPIGSRAPENDFDAISPEESPLHPFEKLNLEYAYMVGRGVILKETKDPLGRPSFLFMDTETFHKDLLTQDPFTTGDKVLPLSKAWLKDKRRREFDGFWFHPSLQNPRYYNYWKGFQYEPLNRKPTRDEQASLAAFLEHARENVCNGDEELYVWLITYFAHLIQKPAERPNVALVMKGKKGTGKNALVERVGALLGEDSFVVTAKREQVIGRFNDLLFRKLMVVLDEAFFAGAKIDDGVMKELITGSTHKIEEKGKAIYKIDNFLRVVILGNEDWLVPATEDERRYAVFNVGDGRIQDRTFFREMRERMEAGGYRLLIKFLGEWNLNQADVSLAPQTEGLAEQQQLTLSPLLQWWRDSLGEGSIVGGAFDGWPKWSPKRTLRSAFYAYAKEIGRGSYLPSDVQFTIQLRRRAPTFNASQKRVEGEKREVFTLPVLEQARKEWDETGRCKTDWGITEEGVFG